MLLQATDAGTLAKELARNIRARTGQRVRDLSVEVQVDVIVLRGETTSWYVKQLAQHSVFAVLPRVGVRNAIVVSGAV
jgi:hypothetical protein